MHPTFCTFDPTVACLTPTAYECAAVMSSGQEPNTVHKCTHLTNAPISSRVDASRNAHLFEGSNLLECPEPASIRTDLRVDCALAKHARMAMLTVRVRADACLCSHALLLSHSTGLTAGWWSSKWKGANCTWAADCIAPSSQLEQAMLPSA